MSHKSFAEVITEDRRLALLRVLSEQPARQMNSSNLDRWLRHIGTPGARAETIADLRWLHEQALIKLEPIPDIDSLYLARLLGAGDDVAQGLVKHPGVSQPSLRG